MNAKRLSIAVAALTLTGALVALMIAPASAHKDSLINKKVEIIMKDIAFEVTGGPLTLKPGEVVEFTIKNEGKMVHDFHLGKDANVNDQLYKNNPFEPFDMLVLEPGQKAKLTLTVPDKVGDWEIGCFQPGHYQAGMKVAFKVAK